MSFLCDVTSTIEPDVFNKQNRSYSHRWQSRPSNKSFLATSPDCSFLRRRLAAVTSQKASFTFLKLCIDRVDASYASVGWFSSVMGADVVAGWASPASRHIIISIPAWDFSDLTRFLHRGHIFSCQTSLKCFFFFWSAAHQRSSCCPISSNSVFIFAVTSATFLSELRKTFCRGSITTLHLSPDCRKVSFLPIGHGR